MSRTTSEAKRRDWQTRFERFRKNGLTVGPSCSAERASVNTFQHWARRLESPSAPTTLQSGSRRLPAATKIGTARAAVAEAASQPNVAANDDGDASPATTVRFLLGNAEIGPESAKAPMSGPF